jgi:amino acid transporter
MGWNYAMQWMTVFPFELVAAGLTVQFWNSNIPSAVFVTIFWLAVVVVNLVGVRGYGEVEFVLSIIKVTAVIGFIILGIVIDVGGSPSGIVYGTTYWRDPGAFNNGFKGVCSVFVTAAFAFAGTELAGLAAAETVSPIRTYLTAGKSKKNLTTSNQTSHLENHHFLSGLVDRNRLSRTLHRTSFTPQSIL